MEVLFPKPYNAFALFDSAIRLKADYDKVINQNTRKLNWKN